MFCLVLCHLKQIPIQLLQNLNLKLSFLQVSGDNAPADGSGFECNVCQQVLPNREQLRVHLGQHKGLYKYRCEFCGRPFSSTTGLLQHKTSHTGVNYFRCQHCPATFSHSYKLGNHVKAEHGGVKGSFLPPMPGFRNINQSGGPPSPSETP